MLMRVVFDLDGTLANIEHRLHLIQKPANWPAFFQACVDDIPIKEMVQTYQAIAEFYPVEIWSGRSDIVRSQTVAWLNRYDMAPDLLRMRKDGDYRHDEIVKAEWLEALPRDQWPSLVFDDRKRVVDMWRAHGIRCCQVAPGDF